MHCLVDSQCLSRPTLHKSTQWDRCALAKHIIHARVQLLAPPQQSLAGPTVLTHTACDTHLVVYLRLGGVRFFKKATCAIRNEGAMQDPLAHGYTRGDSSIVSTSSEQTRAKTPTGLGLCSFAHSPSTGAAGAALLRAPGARLTPLPPRA